MFKMTEEQLAVVHNGERSGFDLIDARNYFDGTNPQKPMIAQIIRTPYRNRGMRIIALATTNRKDASRGPDQFLRTDMINLYVVQKPVEDDYFSMDAFDVTDLEKGIFEFDLKQGVVRKLEDMYPINNIQLTDENNGASISYEAAIEMTRRFASAIAEYGHVKRWDEYIEDGMFLAGMLNARRPDAREYRTEYLPSVIETLEKGRISKKTGEPFRLVGKIKTPELVRELASECERRERDGFIWPAKSTSKAGLRYGW